MPQPLKHLIKTQLRFLAAPWDQLQILRGRLPAYYYAGTLNLGDLLTHYLLSKLYPAVVRQHPPVQVYSHRLPHLMGVGSILRLATTQSWVWGSGIIGEGHWPKQLDAQKITALRGPITRLRLEQHLGLNLPEHLPLGDPGLLLPQVYRPKVQPQYRLGILPHYVDAQRLQALLPPDPDVCILNVQQTPEAFIDQLLACEHLASSSLHGLILADAYGLPNSWLQLSNNLVGGRFKFMDYYATTDQPQQNPLPVTCWQDLRPLHQQPQRYARCKHYQGDTQQLITALQPALKALIPTAF